MASDLNDLEQALQTYFDGLYEGDTAKLGRVFHDVAHLFSVTDGKLADMPREQWFEMVKGRKSAQSQDLPRRDWVVHIDRSSPTTATSAPCIRAMAAHNKPMGPGPSTTTRSPGRTLEFTTTALYATQHGSVRPAFSNGRLSGR